MALSKKNQIYQSDALKKKDSYQIYMIGSRIDYLLLGFFDNTTP